jgi:signal transduction histidine kinase
MIWWFLILGVSTLVVVCVAIAIYVHLRHNLQDHASQDKALKPDGQRQTDRTEP